jgi:hypothetical protein
MREHQHQLPTRARSDDVFYTVGSQRRVSVYCAQSAGRGPQVLFPFSAVGLAAATANAATCSAALVCCAAPYQPPLTCWQSLTSVHLVWMDTDLAAGRRFQHSKPKGGTAGTLVITTQQGVDSGTELLFYCERQLAPSLTSAGRGHSDRMGGCGGQIPRYRRCAAPRMRIVWWGAEGGKRWSVGEGLGHLDQGCHSLRCHAYTLNVRRRSCTRGFGFQSPVHL